MGKTRDLFKKIRDTKGTYEWLKKLWYICTMDYCSTIKGIHLISYNEVDEPGAYYTK